MGTWYDLAYIVPSSLLRHQSDKDEKLAALRKGLELGINFIDTAELYQTENIVAEAITLTLTHHFKENVNIPLSNLL